MIQINNKDEALDMLFAKARGEKNPISQDDSFRMLQGDKTGKLKQFFNPKTTLMTASVLVTFSLLFYLLNPAEKNKNKAVNHKVLTKDEISHELAVKEKPESENNKKFNTAGNDNLFVYNERTNSPYIDPSKNALAINKNVRTLPDSAIAQYTPEPTDVQSITPTTAKLIELPEEVLHKLNISFSQDGICVGSKNDLLMCYNSQGTNLSVSDSFDKSIVNKRITPILITDADGHYWRATYLNNFLEDKFKSENPDQNNDNDSFYNHYVKNNFEFTYPDLKNNNNEVYNARLREFINKEVNSFIPVLVRLPEKYRKHEKSTGSDWGHDLIMWFQPTEAFLGILSDTLRYQIVKGNPSILNNSNANITAKQQSTKYTISLYPNPVTDKATINYQLEKDKKVNIALHDVSGKLIKVFVRNETQNAGNNSFEVDLKDLIQGVYILSIETADGNILTQRVIKQ